MYSQLLLRTHRRKCGRYTHESNGFIVIRGQLEVNIRFDLRLFHFSFGKTEFFLYMDGHPQAMVVLFPYLLATQGFKEATIGIT